MSYASFALVFLTAFAGAAESPKSKVAVPPKKEASPKKEVSVDTVRKRAHEIRNFIGEKAIYDGFVFKAGIRINVGQTTLSVSEKTTGSPAVILNGNAKGGGLGYTLNYDVNSVLDGETCLPRLAKFSQTGSETRFKKFLFQPGMVTYSKLKHCRDNHCKNPKHKIERMTWFGPIPTGKEIVHCPDCEDLDHFCWVVRHNHKVAKQFYDMLSGVYLARTCEFTPGASFTIPLIQKHDRWNVTITSHEEETIKVPAGTFKCVKITIQPSNVGDNPDEKPRFEGLFGLHGSIDIWVEKEFRLPVRVLGTIPFAFLDIHCEACLKSYEKPLAAREKEKAKKNIATK